MEFQDASIKDFMTVHKGGSLALLNYYWYYNIDPQHPTQLFQCEEVGVLHPDGRSELQAGFLKNVEHFFTIQECVNKNPSVPSNRQKLEVWRQTVMECLENRDADMYETDSDSGDVEHASAVKDPLALSKSEPAPASTPRSATEPAPESESESEYTDEEEWI